MRCKTVQNWIELELDGTLPARKKQRLQAHLDTCPQCQKVMEQSRALRGALQALPEQQVPPALRVRLAQTAQQLPHPRRSWAPLAAPLAAAAGVLVLGISVLSGLPAAFGALGNDSFAPQSAICETEMFYAAETAMEETEEEAAPEAAAPEAPAEDIGAARGMQGDEEAACGTVLTAGDEEAYDTQTDGAEQTETGAALLSQEAELPGSQNTAPRNRILRAAGIAVGLLLLLGGIAGLLIALAKKRADR